MNLKISGFNFTEREPSKSCKWNQPDIFCPWCNKPFHPINSSFNWSYGLEVCKEGFVSECPHCGKPIRVVEIRRPLLSKNKIIVKVCSFDPQKTSRNRKKRKERQKKKRSMKRHKK